MKTLNKIILLIGFIGLLTFTSCKKNFEEINTSPNNPAVVPTSALLTNAQKSLIDDIYDEWFSGRQSLLYAQYWSQRNYTSEDRFSLRQTTNNSYYRLIYTDITDLIEIIRLNTDDATKSEMSAYGDNNNQIAVARILKAWAMQILTDTYGDIPYFDAFQGSSNPSPKYDSQKDIYFDLLKELKEAAAQIDETKSGFTSGDVIYDGDMGLWKKFANSLRLRVALRMSKRDAAPLTQLMGELTDADFISSNDENASFHCIGSAAPNSSPMWNAFFDSKRNDFTTCKTLIDILKGVNDTLNSKNNPFVGITDPRLYIYSRPRNGLYLGMPYGLPDASAQAYKGKCATFYGTGSYTAATAIIPLAPDYAPVLMDFAEVSFSLSEAKGWDQSYYVNGIQASMEQWGVASADITTYLAAVPAASEENVFTQKYLALYMQGYQAWAEYRRSCTAAHPKGYPTQLVHPGEITSPGVTFTALSGTDIPRRVTYPQQEFTINGTSVNAAVTRMGGDDLSTKVWWDGGN